MLCKFLVIYRVDLDRINHRRVIESGKNSIPQYWKCHPKGQVLLNFYVNHESKHIEFSFNLV